MQRYFIKNKSIKQNIIEMDEVMLKHMKKVLRYSNGKQVICIDENKQVYLCQIKDIENGLLEIIELLNEDHELDIEVTLVYGLPKGDKFEFVLQKATELGVSRIVPFLSKRSIIKTDKKTFLKKYDRYHRILQEASEQSERLAIPELTELITIDELSHYLSDASIVAYEESSRSHEHTKFYEVLHRQINSLTIIVGPEGGFDESEIEKMKQLNIEACSLGKRILRSETAPLYMLSVIGYERELSQSENH